MSDLYAVFGNPIGHSKSPAIHAAFARQTGQNLVYQAIAAPLDAFPATLAAFVAAGGRGANVTVPFQQQAYALADRLTPRAELDGSVNTLVCADGRIVGDNTDGCGLLRDLSDNLGVALAGSRVLLLGAGGAARGVAPALLDAGISELIIVNRTAERADALADALGEPDRAHSRYWQDLGDLGDFSLIVNATSASRQDQGAFTLPFHLATPSTLAVDLNYGEAAIPFLAWARAAGCHDAVDGLGMLVEQAAEAFEHWHGVRPDTDPVYAALRDRDKVLVTAD